MSRGNQDGVLQAAGIAGSLRQASWNRALLRDRWNGADHIAEALEAAGIEILTNRNHRLPAPFESIWICGLDNFVSGATDAGSALSSADGVRVVLMHAPANLLNLRGEHFDIALCGHTYGGQIVLPGGRR